MSESALGASPTTAQLKKAIKVSAIAHALVFSALMIRTVFFINSEKIDYERAVRVDLVALPDKVDPSDDLVAADPKDSKQAMQEKPKPKAEKTVQLPDENLSAKQKQALQKLKTMSALDDIKKQVEADEANQRKSHVFKGNVLNSGTELRGVNKLQHDSYAAVVEKHIKRFWFIPEWLSGKGLRAVVRVRVDSLGNVLGQDLVKSSGNPSFDEIALGTAQKAAPVPVPREKFVRILANEGIILVFGE